jgi:hypothetical protein
MSLLPTIASKPRLGEAGAMVDAHAAPASSIASVFVIEMTAAFVIVDLEAPR